jgi:ATP-binding cassette subfamily B protein
MAAGSDQDEVLGKAYDAQLARRIWAFVRPFPGLIAGALLLLPVVMVFDLLQPKIIQLAIDRTIARRDLVALPWMALAFLGALLGQHLFGFFQVWFLQLLGQRSTMGLRLALYRHLLSLRAAFFDRMPVGRLMTRVSSDVEAINEAFSAGLVTIGADFLRIGVILVILLRTDWRLTLITLLSAPVLVLIALLGRRTVRTAFRELRARLAALNQFLQEHVSGMKVVQMLGRERDVLARFDQRNARFRDANLLAIKADATVYALVEMIGACAVAALLFSAAGRIARGTLTVGVLVAFIQYADRFFAPIRDLSTKYTIMQSAMAAAERIFGLLDVREPDGAAATPLQPAQAMSGSMAVAAETVPKVEFEHVRFAYQPVELAGGGGEPAAREASEPVLTDVSFRVRAGETVALVGSTGAGKTTIIKLLARLYEAQGGAIRIGGRDTRTLPLDELRRRVVVIPQDGFFFAGTLEENLVIGLGPEARPRLDDAVRRAGADRVIARREGGLAHRVAERGANFSAGERQLLALARALVRDPEILVLDEATASVDPDSERLVERGIAELARGRTSLVIAHRLSTLERADRIVVLHKGKVAEQGAHAQLLALGGLYARLYRLHVSAAGARPSAAAAL